MSSQLTDEQKADIVALKNKGYGSRKIGLIVGCSKSTVNYYLAKCVFTDAGIYLNELKEVALKQKERKSLSGFPVNKPKILFFDIETSLAVSFHFGQWGQNLGVKQQLHESHLLSHAWAWNDNDIEGSVLSQQEALDKDPERLVLELWSLFDNCDIAIGHNSKRFDVRKVNGYFLKYGLPPPSPFKVIDTLQIAKNKFNLPFNSLEYLAKFLGVEQKLDSGGIQTWIDCHYGKREALDDMLYYNKGDVKTLREVYYRLIGWDNNGVNQSLYNDTYDMLCPHCASDNVSSIEGKFTYTTKRKYSLYRCNNCSAVLRGNTQQGESNKLVRVV